MGKPNLPPGVTGGTTKEPEKNIWEPPHVGGEMIVGKLDRVDGTKFSDMAVFPAAFLFSPSWEYRTGPKFLKVPISTMLEGLISAGHSGQYIAIEFQGIGQAKGTQSPPKVFGGVTVFAPKSEEERQIREFLHRAHTNALNKDDPTSRPLDPTAPLDDDRDDLPF
jgi:hypothetical protein